MADPITPEERSRRLAAARAIITAGPAAGMVERETALMLIEVAEGAVLQSESLAREIEKLCDRILTLRVGHTVVKDIAERARDNQFLNEVGAKAVLFEILAVIEGVTK